MKKKKWYAAGYVRLSDADEEKNRKKGDHSNNSESIGNQILIIQNYVEANEDIELVEIYMDDGFTGLNYERDGYKQMMQDIDQGKTNMIITKSLSRLGREQAETLMLFKKEFILKGIRYVAVEDHIDFEERIQDMNIPFKTLMNDMYSMQISNDVRSALRAKAKDGKFIGAFASYGYRKMESDKSKLEIDPYPAEVVRRIFKMYLEENSICKIVDVLNEEEIASPSMYKKNTNSNYHYSQRIETPTYWSYDMTKKILKKRIYTGDMVQHIEEKIAYNMKQKRMLSPEDYIIVENTHPALIDKETFQQVQERLQYSSRKWSGIKGMKQKYAGFFFCGDCGRSMVKYVVKGDMIYRCGTYVKIGKKYCSNHVIKGKELDALVLTEIQKNISEAISEKDLECIEKRKLENKRNTMQNVANSLEIKKANLFQRKENMLNKLSREVISDDEYLIFKKEYQQQLDVLENEIKACNLPTKCGNIIEEEHTIWINNFLKYKNIQEVDRTVILSLIESIKIYQEGRIEITFKFKNPFQNI